MGEPGTGWLRGGWRGQHLDCCRVARPGGADLALFGDSLLQGWGGEGREVEAPGAGSFAEAFGGRRVANLAVAGDRVRHLRWRLEHGALDGLEPGRLLLLVGTNDLSDGAEPDEVAAAAAALAASLLERLPSTRLLVHGLLPRGADPEDPLRAAAAAVNERLAGLVEGMGERAEFAAPCADFLDPDGALAAGLYQPDALHLTPAGYAAWAAALAPRLDAAPALPAAPAFADGEPRALERAWIRAEAETGLIATGVVAAASAIGLAAAAAFHLVEDAWLGILTAAWLVLAPALLWLAVRWPRWEYPRAGYRILPDRIESWRGLFWRRAWSVPCSRVQFTDVSQGPIQRRHGIATLQVHTAGVASSEVSVPGLPHALALEIRDWLVSRTADDAV